MNSNDLEALKEILTYHRAAAIRLHQHGNRLDSTNDKRAACFRGAQKHKWRAEVLDRVINEPGFTAVDMATAAADGFKDGQRSITLSAEQFEEFEKILEAHPASGNQALRELLARSPRWSECK